MSSNLSLFMVYILFFYLFKLFLLKGLHQQTTSILTFLLLRLPEVIYALKNSYLSLKVALCETGRSAV